MEFQALVYRPLPDTFIVYEYAMSWYEADDPACKKMKEVLPMSMVARINQLSSKKATVETIKSQKLLGRRHNQVRSEGYRDQVAVLTCIYECNPSVSYIVLIIELPASPCTLSTTK